MASSTTKKPKRKQLGWLGIGLCFGLVAGLIGALQWVITERDLAEQNARFHHMQQLYPPYDDFTPFGRNNFMVWLSLSCGGHGAPSHGLFPRRLCCRSVNQASTRWVSSLPGWLPLWAVSSTPVSTRAAIDLGPDPLTTQSHLTYLPLFEGILIIGFIFIALGGAFGGASARPRPPGVV